MNMTWLQLIFNTEIDHVESLSDALTTAGAVAVTLQDAGEQPLYEPAVNTTPLWQQTRVIGLFSGDINPQSLHSELQSLLSPLPPYQSDWLAEQDWNRAWMVDFHPMVFGERLWICPSWQTPPEPQAINVFLDPGLAFGSGTHPTTALCLEWLAQQQNLAGKTVLDYGCGSGILAIAAAKLGADLVWAVDHDPQALQATEDNAKKNQVALQTFLPEALPELQADILLANILAKPLIELVPAFITHLKSSGWLILSGILQPQISEVTNAYRSTFMIREVIECEGWMRLVGQKKINQ
jgi:ribosomal protein L11 methyltransferase